jgi:hypothetical protein
VSAPAAAAVRETAARAPRRTRGAFVVVVGPDGAGKTTVARALVAAFPGETGYFHFAPPVLGPLAAAPSDVSGVCVHKGGPGGSVLLGWVRLARNFVRFWLGYLRTVRPAVRRGALVVGDRWAYGYLVQPHALKYFGPPALAALALRWLPRPDLVVNLAAPAAVVHARQQVLPVARLADELAAWAGLRAARLRTFDATAAPDELAHAVLAAIAP